MKELAGFSAPLRNYVVVKLNWAKYFAVNYPNAQVVAGFSGAGIDRKALKGIAGIADVDVRDYLLSRLGWTSYYAANY